ncbi:MAG TPA: Lrp/AsnC family transcriptional regulator [Intrasporangium sp.]|uniref:Lrp/AsnC family transcriptional regulator n=1 Tax=Intrasporangium sp. TaxID=1925024 RepID=UPI002B46C875|nr:Lrp/AsnC family transcriptional regulator [Intrasporangium sp.]HKX67722.1 Lrp/AsnC family transcriptional regulator [Intrasporangium sp.]
MPTQRRTDSKNPRVPYPVPPPRPIDATDRALVQALLEDGRLSNAELARRVGLPESTCSGRVRALRESGVIRGIHADVNHAALGRPMEAIIALRFAGHTRTSMDSFRERIAAVPGVIAAFHVAGADDFLVHVTAPSSDDLRDLVLDHLTSVEGVAHAQTSLVFERIPGVRQLG